jgi:wyosine [tRNA(Phe)-imidazoG37] synthetase (radical SAM superfamily)
MKSAKLDIFSQHSRSWQANRYVYPVISRRSRGLSIGINLNPDKVCNFDCIYCCVDRTTPGDEREIDLSVLRSELDQLLTLATSGELFTSPPFDQTPPELRRLNDVAFSGDGEPTSCPLFGDACRLAVDLLRQHNLPEVKIVVITNATLLHRPAVGEALAFLDQHNGEIWAKLEAGTEEYYQLVERTSIPLTRVIENIAAAGRVRPVVIQSLFMNIQGQPPAASEIAAYIEQLRGLLATGCRIKLVQIYTVARRTAEQYVTPLADEALDAIASKVRGVGLAVETYYGLG